MRWQGMLGLAALLLLAAGNGCGSNRTLLNADQALLDAIAQAGMDGPSPLSRAQKPDSSRGWTADSRAIDARPERAAEVNGLPPTARIAVTVNGQAILEQEIRAACSHLLRGIANLPESERSTREAEIFNAARDQLIDRELVIQDMEHKLSSNKQAEKTLEKIRDAGNKEFERWQRNIMESQHLNSVEEFKEFLRQVMGATYEMARRQVARSFMSTEFAKHEVFRPVSDVGNAAIQAYYDSHPEDFRVDETVEWQDLFINAGNHPSREAARRFAEVLMARASSREDFVKLAQEFDNGVASQRENAAGEGMKRGEIKPAEVESTLFQMHDGDVRVVELYTGYHVVKLVKHTQMGQMPFDEKVQKRIKDKIQNEVFQRELKHYFTELKRKTFIEKYDNH